MFLQNVGSHTEYTALYPRRWHISRTSSVRTVCVPPEIRTRHLQNTSEKLEPSFPRFTACIFSEVATSVCLEGCEWERVGEPAETVAGPWETLHFHRIFHHCSSRVGRVRGFRRDDAPNSP
jgi:hypothetical protein